MSPTDIPLTQRAAVIHKFGSTIDITSSHPVVQPSALTPGQCLVKIEYAGVCHSDLNALYGDWATKPTLPRVGGHEGVGHIVAIGEHTVEAAVKVGDRVGLKWLAKTCLKCEFCRLTNESSCPTRTVHGFTFDGTFCEYAVAWVDYVTSIPKSIDSATATAILCAGLTVFKGLKQANLLVGQWIAIPGAGGGLGHLAVQYAVLMGLRVLAIDTGEAKRELCTSLGAEKWIDFKESQNLIADVIKATDGQGPHIALIASSAATPYNQACMYLRPTGTLVALGLPAGAVLSVPILVLVGKELKIVGSAIGNRQDAVESMDIAARGKVKCHYGVKTLEELNSIFADMEEGKITGRIMLKF
ncbi:hypothetical protein SERLA73DRAFT_186238 [Serpula lacrymans var. lacrymans S7.3]|uniref:alcohol dehydrogenase n=2 Tax=Serpula lacrymans var. lacrymans TaxID=341189 RepID=F8Q5L4_SERL3|nr:uncharacterized protein SERLADRAFT_475179 [Serpula lacrymans var. lacrymans S7.9]EGN96485.1 hypothetical protein SERLA73DRAFT_186238 [Serpula lacrymans var. lacrymans S7.3]EGO22032.1 hypothetical protein SERLADRAFT_475179 [Serpula lacrymans var. lacrymans S7.9]